MCSSASKYACSLALCVRTATAMPGFSRRATSTMRRARIGSGAVTTISRAPRIPARSSTSARVASPEIGVLAAQAQPGHDARLLLDDDVR